ncbi:MAG: F0F1 ATP synthase subunit delta [Pseudomonadota bacterium]
MAGEHGPATGVAGRYATALFELAKESNAVDAVEADLSALSAAMDGSPELRAFIKSPVYNRDDQLRAITAIAERAGSSALTSNFLKLLAKNGRLFSLPDVIKTFAALAAEDRGEAPAEAVSATAMTADQVSALRQELEAMVGKRVTLETRVDPDLLGGLVVKVGSKMVDASLRTKLNRLKSELKEA